MLPVPKVRRGRQRLADAAELAPHDIEDPRAQRRIQPRVESHARAGPQPLRTGASASPRSSPPRIACGRDRVLSSHRDIIWSVSMQIEERGVGDVIVLDLKGKIPL